MNMVYDPLPLEVIMEDYDIEPFMPGISPVGKGSTGTVGFSVPRPYIPYGTGYKLIKKSPGFSSVFNNVARDTNIVEYDFDQALRRRSGLNNKLPEVRTARLATHSNINNASKDGGWHNDLRKYISKPSYVGNEFSSRGGPEGAHYSNIKHVTVPAHDYVWDYNKDRIIDTRRHEFIHRMQSEDMPRYSKELEAYIGANKSIRKGLQNFGPEAKYYVSDFAADKYPDSKLKRSGEYVKNVALKSTPTALAGSASKLVPGKPGMFTGRIPSFQGMGAGLVDMFMEGPALQEAKTNPLVGMGNRAEIEAAYEYGL